MKDQFAETHPDPDHDESGEMLGYKAARMTQSEARTWGLVAHLSPLLVGFIGPLVVWLLKKDESEYVSRHAKEALNFQISLFLWVMVSVVLSIIIIGIFLLMALMIVALVFPILAAVKSNEGEDYHYPLTIRLIK